MKKKIEVLNLKFRFENGIETSFEAEGHCLIFIPLNILKLLEEEIKKEICRKEKNAKTKFNRANIKIPSQKKV